MRLASEEPRVQLTKTFTTPFDNAVATARTCYSSRIITDDDVAAKPDQRDRIARSVYLAGHHTTLQHANFQFAVENLSRQAIWGFFHAHTFYNSEQVSQRYVEVKPGRVLVPELDGGELQQVYRAAVERQMATYQRLLEELRPAVEAVYFGVFPGRRGPDGHGKTQAYTRAITKKCQEMARYVLPVATHAHLYHTISGLTLHRYHRAAHALDCPSEQRAVIDAMVDEVKKVDASFFDEIEDTLPLEDTHEARVLQSLSQTTPRDPERALQFRREFDAKLEGHASKLWSYTERGDAVLGDAVREVFGLCEDELDDASAVALLLDPADNPYLGEALSLGTLSKAMRALELPQFTFKKCLSHTADSQAQRHRMTPGVRPALTRHVVPGMPDYVTPEIFEHPLAEVARRSYDDEMDATWADIKTLADAGAPEEAWQYLLPNAVKVRFTETGPLLHQHHKWTTRLCYNAQEEIWKATLDEVNQVCAVAPEIGAHLLPPCGLRARARSKPICPERDRFCGVTVWRKPRAEWLRVL